MDISGKLIQILPAQTGTGKNGPWKKCDFVIETSDKFPKKVCISAWNDQCSQIEKIAIGSDLKVSFDISSREYNSRWYTDVKAWKIAVEGSAPPQNSNEDEVVQYNKADFENEQPADDLPF
ncbi:MAG: DUF3127 domain-containing protein [Bacteroidetes bacterium]|nr:DUF3127 domain-containing protein [Bacteroidota bacterium]